MLCVFDFRFLQPHCGVLLRHIQHRRLFVDLYFLFEVRVLHANQSDCQLIRGKWLLLVYVDDSLDNLATFKANAHIS